MVGFGYFVFIFALFLGFRDRVSLYSFVACPGTHSVDQAGLELTEICLLLGLKARASMAEQTTFFFIHSSTERFATCLQLNRAAIKCLLSMCPRVV